MLTLVLILAVAAGLRYWQLGQLSFWYDEVVTMRLARAPTPAALIDRLFADRRDPGTPSSPPASRLDHVCSDRPKPRLEALSVLCGVADSGPGLLDRPAGLRVPTGLWAAWLAALSPPLVYYSREARMYAWLVMLTCLCWGLLFSGDRRARRPPAIACQDGRAIRWPHRPALLPSPGAAHGRHPGPGLAALRTASSSATGGAGWVPIWRPRSWPRPGCGTTSIIPPSSSPGRCRSSSLIGTPIGFIGGNFLVLARTRRPDRLRPRPPPRGLGSGLGDGRAGLPAALARRAAHASYTFTPGSSARSSARPGTRCSWPRPT